MKKMIQITGTAYKEQSGHLSTATLDRAENAVTYRVLDVKRIAARHMKKILPLMKSQQ